MSRRLLIASLLAVLALGVAAGSASAAFGLRDLGVSFSNKNGSVASNAGTHPFEMTTTLGVNTVIVPGGAIDPDTELPVDGEAPDGEVRDLTIAQMPGFVGDQTAIPRCTNTDFAQREEGYASCPDSTAVGIAAVKAEFSIFPVGEEVFLHLPIYNLVPPPGVAAEFGFVAANVPVTFDVVVNQEEPHNLIVKLVDIPQALQFYSSQVTLWGVPGNADHNELRGKCVGSPTEPTADPISKGSCPVFGAEAPLLTLPRSCQGPLTTVFDAKSWEGDLDSGFATTPEMTNCGLLPFGPEIAAQPTAASADSPTGLDFDLIVDDPGLTSAGGTAASDIKKVVATLPPGVTANPSAAEGLGVCTVAQYESADLTKAGCPEASKLGTVTISTPLLEEPVHGTVFLAEPDDPTSPEPENPFDSLLALYLVIRNENLGLFIKQAGSIDPDPKTGQLVSTFEGIPELPFSHLNLHFREGPRAPLVTPPTCGSFESKAEFTPWSGNAPVEATATFTINSGPGGAACPAGGLQPFKPHFQAGTMSNGAGTYSPFYMRLTRQDGEQDMTRFDSILPPGVVGKIAGVERCSDAALAAAKEKSGRAELASPSCPAGSRIGHVLVGAGVGSALTYVPGQIYLAGPFGGDPLSVAVITPAVAGPFDVGTVVTREALTLDPNTAEVQVDGSVSDPIPNILRGIPLKLRDLRVYLDRPDFTLNATSCNEKQIRATLFGDGSDPFGPADDVPAALSDRYQAANCSSLGFKPRLTLKLKGGTRRNAHPSLRSVLIPRPGDANIGKAVVTLPHSEFIDQSHINNPCTRVQFAANACPPASILGTARAVTPLLEQPLEGPVYFRSNGGDRDLPDIVADLHGQFNIVLVGFVDSINERIRTTFQTVPDAPVSEFTLSLNGGKKGLLVNSANLCAKPRHVALTLSGQNGTVYKTNPVLGTSCKGKKKHKHRR